MSKNGDVVWANGAAWQRDNEWEGKKKQWWIAPPVEGLNGQKTLKKLKAFKDFVWIVKNGERQFYTYAQANDLVAEIETSRAVDLAQRQTIAYYQDLVNKLRDLNDDLQDQLEQLTLVNQENLDERDAAVQSANELQEQFDDHYLNKSVRAAYITALNHAIQAIEEIREDELNDSN